MLGEIAVEILQYLDVNDLNAAERVSTVWREAVLSGKLWEKLFKRNVSSNVAQHTICLYTASLPVLLFKLVCKKNAGNE